MCALSKLWVSMFQDLYVIKETGECLFHKAYGPTKYDPTIVSSFLSAVSLFSANFDDDTRLIETKSSRFVYHRVDEIIVVARVSRDIPVHKVEETLKKIGDAIKKKVKFSSNEFSGAVKEFNKIESEIDKTTKYSLNDEEVIPEDFKVEINPKIRYWFGTNDAERKVFSYVRFKGKASIKEISKLMRVPEIEAWRAAQKLLSMNILRKIEPPPHSNAGYTSVNYPKN